MKLLLVSVAFTLGCILIGTVGSRGLGEAASATITANLTEEITGKIIAADVMYEEGTQIWYKAEINLQEGGADFQRGAIYLVRYPYPSWARAIAPDYDESITLKVHRVNATDWTAEAPPVIVARPELLKPGQRATEEMGTPSAKILVKLLVPLSPECHQKTAKLLGKLIASKTDQVRLQIFDMDTPAGRQELNREQVSCATILIRSSFITT